MYTNKKVGTTTYVYSNGVVICSFGKECFIKLHIEVGLTELSLLTKYLHTLIS